MSRHGYVDDCDDPLALGRWRAQVASAIRGKRGQAFLRELAEALDAMPVKELIAEELVTAEGDCCAMGAVCKKRGLDVSGVDPEDREHVGGMIGIAHQLVSEIAYENDELGECYSKGPFGSFVKIKETPAERWTRMRAWVAKRIK